MRAVHNGHDLDLIEMLIKLTVQVAKDASAGLSVDTSPTLAVVRSYVLDARNEAVAEIRCDGVTDLPFPPAMRTLIPEDASARLRLIHGDVEENYCSIWCLLMHYYRIEGMEILPKENRLECVN